MKKSILQTGRAIVAMIILMMIIIVSVASYEYLKVKLSPLYNAETMTLNYEITGSGPKNMILIHGLVGSKNYWKRGMDSIAQTHKLFLVDLLGFGDSPKPQSTYSLDEQVDAMEKIMVKEGLDDGQTMIVGHSLGSIITLALFSRHPEWFKSAVVIGLPVVISEVQFKKAMAAHSRFDGLAVSRWGKIICMLQPLYMIKWFKPKDMPEDVFSDAKKHTWQSYYYSLNEIIMKTDLYALTKNIKDKKILFIQGEKDKTAPLANVKHFSRTFRNAKLIEMKNGDHQLFLKEPEKVWGMINEFSKDGLFNKNLRTGEIIKRNTIPHKIEGRIHRNNFG